MNDEPQPGHDASADASGSGTADSNASEPSANLDRFPEPSPRRLAVRVTDDALRWIRAGHPWLFADSITSVSNGGQPGDLAVVFDRKRRFRAIGLYDPASPIRVKLLHHGAPTTIDAAWFDHRITEALSRRRALLDAADTTGVRCLNGENDGLPSLVVDRYAHVAVVKLYSAAWFAHLSTVVPIVVSALGVDTVVLRLARNVVPQAPAGVADGMALVGAVPTAPVEFAENGLVVEADVVAGNKTGYFLDQRDNRRLVGEQAAGARVLDVFSSSGGFSLAAAAGGAQSVLSVDVSAPALEAARRNFAHNRDRHAVRHCRHETRRGDAFAVMADLADREMRFDIVVVDPPSFAHTAAGVSDALRSYANLTRLACALVVDGGLLVQASCTARVTSDDFFATVTTAAHRAGVELSDVRRTGHPVDHPIGFDRGEYLKALFARVHHEPHHARSASARPRVARRSGGC